MKANTGKTGNKVKGTDQLIKNGESFIIKSTNFMVGEKSIDLINNPPHYKANGVEVIDVIDAFELDFYTGTVLAYILRAGRKPECSRLEDLKKAQWYLNRLIAGEDDTKD